MSIRHFGRWYRVLTIQFTDLCVAVTFIQEDQIRLVQFDSYTEFHANVERGERYMIGGAP